MACDHLLSAVQVFGAIKDVIQSARRRKFSIKVGENELTVEEASEQQRILINDLQEQLHALKKTVDSTVSDEQKVRVKEATSPRHISKILWVDDYPSNNASIIAHLSDLGSMW
jgi:hypothetical protein